jgi:hypothetical protein
MPCRGAGRNLGKFQPDPVRVCRKQILANALIAGQMPLYKKKGLNHILGGAMVFGMNYLDEPVSGKWVINQLRK